MLELEEMMNRETKAATEDEASVPSPAATPPATAHEPNNNYPQNFPLDILIIII